MKTMMKRALATWMALGFLLASAEAMAGSCSWTVKIKSQSSRSVRVTYFRVTAGSGIVKDSKKFSLFRNLHPNNTYTVLNNHRFTLGCKRTWTFSFRIKCRYYHHKKKRWIWNARWLQYKRTINKKNKRSSSAILKFRLKKWTKQWC